MSDLVERLLDEATYRETGPIYSTERLELTMREAASEIKALRAWKAEAIEVLCDLDLQGIGRLLRFPLGTNIAKEIKPAIDRLLKEAVLGGASCHSAEHAMPETASNDERQS